MSALLNKLHGRLRRCFGRICPQPPGGVIDAQALEPRVLFSATMIDFFPDTGEVVIEGSDAHDLATVSYVNETDVAVRIAGDDGTWHSETFSGELVKQVTFHGNSGDDTFVNETAISAVAHGNDGHDILIGGAGNDRLWGDEGSDRLFGRHGDDTLDGGDEDDTVAGGGGNDILRGGPGRDLLLGDVGHDALIGGDGEDRIWGQDGHDLLIGGLGKDDLFGGSGDDLLIGDYTVHDQSAAALEGILTVWSADDEYDVRMAVIEEATAPWQLAVGTTVHDDGFADQLVGQAGRDWFFVPCHTNVLDKILDLQTEEYVSTEHTRSESENFPTSDALSALRSGDPSLAGRWGGWLSQARDAWLTDEYGPHAVRGAATASFVEIVSPPADADSRAGTAPTTENVRVGDDMTASAAADHLMSWQGYRWWRGNEGGIPALRTIAGTEWDGWLQFHHEVGVRDTPAFKSAWTLLSVFGSALLAAPEVEILGAVFGDVGPADGSDALDDTAADSAEDQPDPPRNSNSPVRFHHVGPAVAATAVALMNRWRALQEQMARDADEADDTEEFIPHLQGSGGACLRVSDSHQAAQIHRPKRLSLARALTIAYHDDSGDMRT